MPEFYFDHIHLRSLDPLKTAEFYEQMFGAKRISTRDNGNGRITAQLDLKGVTILINQPREGEPTGLEHFGIRTDNLNEAVLELKEKGVNFSQDVKQARPDFKFTHLAAPENVSIELQEGQF